VIATTINLAGGDGVDIINTVASGINGLRLFAFSGKVKLTDGSSNGVWSGDLNVFNVNNTLGFCAGSQLGIDTFIVRDGTANVLAMQNGSNAQEWRVYGTTAGNKYASIKHDGTNMTIKDSNSGVVWRTGAGTPEGAVTAPVGSLYTRTDGGASSTLYVKESGTSNTGWIAK
jgi:hypothetical protein